MRAALVFGIAAAALGAAGCGGIVDVAYLISNKRTSKTVEERSPTGQVRTAVEYEGAAGNDGLVLVTCEERDRFVERSSSVEKVYRYRGSFSSSTYAGTAVLSGLTAGGVAGVVAAICLKDEMSTPEQKEGCLVNMLFATPFAVDSIYSSIRAATAKEPKLVEKHASNPILAFSSTPSRRAPVSCESARLYLRSTAGPPEQSADDILSGRPPDPASGFLEGATAIPLPPDGKVALRALPEVVGRWADDPGLALWIVGEDGRQHQLRVNRCDALRPLLQMIAPEVQAKFLVSCAPPPPASPR